MLYRRKWSAIIAVITILLVMAGCHGGKHEANGATDHKRPPLDEQRKQQLRQLDETAAKMYAEVMKGDISLAREHMIELSEQVTSMEFSGITTVEGLEALTEAVVNAKHLMNAVQTEQQLIQTAATQVRLSTNALIAEHHPLWFEYEKTLRADTEQLRTAIQGEGQMLTTVQQLHRDYGIIRPAVIISRPSEVNVKIESLLAFFMQQVSQPNERLLEPLHQLTRTWDELFNSSEQSAYMPIIEGQRPIYWSFVIGSIIITVLCFVAWRKYQGEFDIVSVSGRRD